MEEMETLMETTTMVTTLKEMDVEMDVIFQALTLALTSKHLSVCGVMRRNISFMAHSLMYPIAAIGAMLAITLNSFGVVPHRLVAVLRMVMEVCTSSVSTAQQETWMEKLSIS